MDESSKGVNPSHVAGTDFVMVHMDLLDELGGDFHAAILFARIQFRAGTDGWWEATQERVLADTRLTAHQLRRALGVLRDAGYVETVRLRPYDPTLKYRVLIAENTETTVNEDFTITRTRETKSREREIHEHMTEDFTITPSSKNVEEQKKEPPVVPNGFDEFYKAYPRKKQRGQAEKAWTKAVKHTDPSVIVAGAVQFRQWCERDRKEAQFIPYPSTWLNGKGWLDERDPEPLTAAERRQQGFADLLSEFAYNESVPNPLELEG